MVPPVPVIVTLTLSAHDVDEMNNPATTTQRMIDLCMQFVPLLYAATLLPNTPIIFQQDTSQIFKQCAPLCIRFGKSSLHPVPT
jgi:hypothetical protein